MDITELRTEIHQLINRLVGAPAGESDRDEAILRIIEIRKATDRIGAILEDVDDEAAKKAADLGVILKLAPKCRHWTTDVPRGRPRDYCSDECKNAARAERS